MKTLLTLTLLLVAVPAWAEPNYEALADAIYKAEGGAKTSHPYGIMARYKHTSPRQACLNTLKHRYRLYLLLQPRSKATKEGYLRYLSSTYAPQNAPNDPHGLNKNWLTNVSKLYKGDI